jgi:hypothetical protein
MVETALAKSVPDKTNWRALLKGDADPIDLKAHRDALFASWASDLPGEKLFAEEVPLAYPVLRYPAKIVSLNLDKEPEVKGELIGVKGQYLIFDVGVINMRKYAGYELEWEAESAAATEDLSAAAAPIPAPPLSAAGETSQLTLL